MVLGQDIFEAAVTMLTSTAVSEAGVPRADETTHRGGELQVPVPAWPLGAWCLLWGHFPPLCRVGLGEVRTGEPPALVLSPGLD